MRLMVASDIHGSAYYGKKLLEAYDREQADRLLLLGDILYHGPRNTWLYDAGRGWYQMENIRRKDYIVKNAGVDSYACIFYVHLKPVFP